jgi:hypothetical protein
MNVDTTPDMPADIGIRPEAADREGQKSIKESDPAETRLVGIFDGNRVPPPVTWAPNIRKAMEFSQQGCILRANGEPFMREPGL